jgi:uncharacterized damage-inducible protein DinB
MPTSNLLDTLLSHDRWATEKILGACSALSADQFERRFNIGPGSLQDTTTHILGAMRRWGDLLAGREQRARLEGSKCSPAELLKLLDEIASDFAASARKHAVDEIVSGVRDGKTYTLPRAVVISHVATHGMHHRAQCLNMLRQLGVSPLPPSDVIVWSMNVDDKG